VSFNVEDPVVQLIDADSMDILYTVRVNGKAFTPGAPKGKKFILKAGKNAPDQIVLKDAKVGGKAQSIKLK